jgi:hypothetical protein
MISGSLSSPITKLILVMLIVFPAVIGWMPGLPATPAKASIVDLSGIEVPPANGPSCPDCPGEDCNRCGEGNDNTGDTGDPVDNTPAPHPQPQPTPQPAPTPPAPTPPLQPLPPPVDPVQQQFDREKEALINDFRIPAEVVVDLDSMPAEPISINEDTVFGVGPAPVGLSQPGGLSAQEWRQAGEAQWQIDALDGKWPLSNEEIARLEQAESQRNALWKKAVSIPGLTAEERERLRLEFHVRGLRAGEPAPPVVTPDAIEQWEKAPPPPPFKEPATSAPVPTPVNPVTAMVLKHFLVNQPTAGAEYIGEKIAGDILEDAPFGNILALAKIPVAYKQGGEASARAATADFLVGLFPIPQATFAVEGGRVYANVANQALNKFMTDAMASVGVDFDKEKFWSDLKNQSSVGTQALMEWLNVGSD